MSYIPQLSRLEAEILDRELHGFDTVYTDVGAILQELIKHEREDRKVNKRQLLNEAIRRVNDEQNRS